VFMPGHVECQFAQNGWQELYVSSRRASKMARNWRGLGPAEECSGLKMMMMMMRVFMYKLNNNKSVKVRYIMFNIKEKAILQARINYYSFTFLKCNIIYKFN
jgi:hypothetical protein